MYTHGVSHDRLTTGIRSGGDCAPPTGFGFARSWLRHSHAKPHPHLGSLGTACPNVVYLNVMRKFG